MKLEVGKKYRNKNGSVIEIYSRHPIYEVYHGALDLSKPIADIDRGYRDIAFDADGKAFDIFSNLIEEYEEPAKYSVDIYMNKKPQYHPERPTNGLIDLLFGCDNFRWFVSKPVGGVIVDKLRKVKITVEEVEE